MIIHQSLRRKFTQVQKDARNTYKAFIELMFAFLTPLTFSAVVPENVPIGISVINVTATDPDEGLGGEIKYDFLDEGEANGKKIFVYKNTVNCLYYTLVQCMQLTSK